MLRVHTDVFIKVYWYSINSVTTMVVTVRAGHGFVKAERWARNRRNRATDGEAKEVRTGREGERGARRTGKQNKCAPDEGS